MHKENLYEEVIRRNSDMVYRLAYSLVKTRTDADDIYQEVFMRYLKARQVFESREHEKAWFIRVTVNCCKNYWKSPWIRRRAVFREETAMQDRGYIENRDYIITDCELASEETDCVMVDSGMASVEAGCTMAGAGLEFEETEAASGSEEQRLIEIVKQLPEKYRIVIHLFYYEEMSIEEIGKITGTKVSTVRTRLTRARRRLKEKLGGI